MPTAPASTWSRPARGAPPAAISILTAKRFFTPRRIWPARSAHRVRIFPRDMSGPCIRDMTFSRRIPNTPGYDAEATISLDGKKITFTSMRNGDLDIYSMDADGRNVKQLTHELGYDGGPTYSPDRQWIVYRAYHPQTEKEIAEYKG